MKFEFLVGQYNLDLSPPKEKGNANLPPLALEKNSFGAVLSPFLDKAKPSLPPVNNTPFQKQSPIALRPLKIQSRLEGFVSSATLFPQPPFSQSNNQAQLLDLKSPLFLSDKIKSLVDTSSAFASNSLQSPFSALIESFLLKDSKNDFLSYLTQLLESKAGDPEELGFTFSKSADKIDFLSGFSSGFSFFQNKEEVAALDVSSFSQSLQTSVAFHFVWAQYQREEESLSLKSTSILSSEIVPSAALSSKGLETTSLLSVTPLNNKALPQSPSLAPVQGSLQSGISVPLSAGALQPVQSPQATVQSDPVTQSAAPAVPSAPVVQSATSSVPATSVAQPATPAIPTASIAQPAAPPVAPVVPAAPVAQPATPAVPTAPIAQPAAQSAAPVVPTAPVAQPATPAVPTAPIVQPAAQSATPAVPATPVAQSATPAVPATPVAQSATPAVPATPVAQSATPAVPATPVAQSATPAVPATPVAQSATPAVPATPVAQSATPAVPATPVAQSATPAVPATPVAQSATPAVPATPVAQSATPAVSATPVAQSATPAVPATPVAQPATPAVPATPVAQPATPAVPATPVAQPATPAVPATPVTQSATPAVPATPVAQSATPAVPAAPIAQSATPAVPATPVAQSATPAVPATPVTQSATPAVPAAPVAQSATPAVPAAPVAQSAAPVVPSVPAAQPATPAVPATPVVQPATQSTAPVVPSAPVAQSATPAVPAAPIVQPAAQSAVPVVPSAPAAQPKAPAAPAAPVAQSAAPVTPAASIAQPAVPVAPVVPDLKALVLSHLSGSGVDANLDLQVSASSVFSEPALPVRIPQGIVRHLFTPPTHPLQFAEIPQGELIVDLFPGAKPKQAQVESVILKSLELPQGNVRVAPTPESVNQAVQSFVFSQLNFVSQKSNQPYRKESTQEVGNAPLFNDSVASQALEGFVSVLALAYPITQIKRPDIFLGDTQQARSGLRPSKGLSFASQLSSFDSMRKGFSQAFALASATQPAPAKPVSDLSFSKEFAESLSLVKSLAKSNSSQSSQPSGLRYATVEPRVARSHSFVPQSSLPSQPGAQATPVNAPAVSVDKAPLSAPPMKELSGASVSGLTGHLSAGQVIQAINQNLPLPVSNFPEFVNQVLQTKSFTSGIKQSIEVTLAPKHLGSLTAQFALTQQNKMVITVYTQSLMTAKALDSYVHEIQQIVGKTEFSLGNLTIKQGIPPVKGGQLNGQANQQSDFFSKYSSKRGRHNRRRRQDDDMTIDVTV